MDKTFGVLACVILLAGASVSHAYEGAAGKATITVDVGATGVPISPDLYGIFFEDINHAADSGIYAELIRNRSFEDTVVPDRCTELDNKFVTPNGWETNFPNRDKMPGWKIVCEGDMSGTVALDDKVLLNDANPRSLRITAEGGGTGRFGVANEGFWGIPLKKDEVYRLSFFAKAAEGFQGAIEARLEGTGNRTHAVEHLQEITTEWRQYSCELKSNDDDRNARLTITMSSPGTLWIDFVSLMPAGANGIFRPDLIQMLKDMKPAFLRFPGGCIVEGFTKETAWRWKKTLGPVHERPGHWNLWGYRFTNGLGYHEYLLLCEELGAAPMFVINCGMSCQGRKPEYIPMEELDEWVQDALDAIEYANGPVDSTWGKVRAGNGHPEPFHLKYLEIGNENSGPEYEKRYKRFYEAINAQYPEVILISNTTVDAPMQVVDEHYYESPDSLASRATQYDARDRKGPKIYVGEYAVVAECGQGNLRAALAEAAFMTGMERNADYVIMASYAPLFVNVHDRCWNPDAICFDNSKSYGTPSYQVQKLFSENRADESLPIEVTCDTQKSSFSGRIGVGTWETQAEFTDIRVTKGDKVLYESDFSKDAAGWEFQKGQWGVKNGALQQTGAGTDFRALFGDPTWQDYTLTLKAKKISGQEGFLILFDARDNKNWFWWNLGGWGNVRHAIERGGGGPMQPAVDGQIETGRWYDIKIEVEGDRIRCSLDGKLMHDIRVPAPPALTACAGLVKASSEVVLKVVNRTAESQKTEIALNGAANVAPEGRAIVLTSWSPDDENSLDFPDRVIPVESPALGVANSFRYTFAPYSVTVIRAGVGMR